MHMEELTKSQIILLTLFVSFVTSIATGIVTVSLTQQAPPAITQSVSRVIQETVQTVAPKSVSQSASPTVTQEKTVVVTEGDLISKSVGAASPSLVRLYVGDEDAPVFVGLGVVLSGSGVVATDLDALGGSNRAVIYLPDGSSVHASIFKRDSLAGVAYLAPATSTPAKWTPIPVSTDHVVLGQVVIGLSGKSAVRIASGIVDAFVASGSSTSSPQIIETSIPGEALLPGSPLIDENGALIGLSTASARLAGAADFMSASALSR